LRDKKESASKASNPQDSMSAFRMRICSDGGARYELPGPPSIILIYKLKKYSCVHVDYTGMIMTSQHLPPMTAS
jgi:hypothetical protein